jgi:hypothetical protein
MISIASWIIELWLNRGSTVAQLWLISVSQVSSVTATPCGYLAEREHRLLVWQ